MAELVDVRQVVGLGLEEGHGGVTRWRGIVRGGGVRGGLGGRVAECWGLGSRLLDAISLVIIGLVLDIDLVDSPSQFFKRVHSIYPPNFYTNYQ